MEMWCIPSWQMGLFGSCYLVGYAISGLLMRVGDWMGKIKYLQILTFTNIVVVVFITWVPYIWPRIIGMTFLGLLAVRMALGYMSITEFLPDYHSTLANSTMVCFDIILTIIIPAIYYGWISITWTYFFYFFLALSIINPFMLLWLPETPKQLYEQ